MTAHVPLLLPCNRDKSLILSKSRKPSFSHEEQEMLSQLERERASDLYSALCTVTLLRGGWTRARVCARSLETSAQRLESNSNWLFLKVYISSPCLTNPQ